ncbi:MAG: hypothetical protein ABEL76_07700, partial [Bradymonadaceae bacterium]
HHPSSKLTRREVYTSMYTVVARDEADLRSIADDDRWRPAQTAGVVWTDSYTNIASIVDW